MSDWTDDQIDALLRDNLGEIEADRFDELLQQAILEVGREPEVTAPAVTKPKRMQGSSMTTTRWLMAAAAVVVVGFVAVIATGRPGGGGTGIAADDPRASTSQGPVAGPPKDPCELASGGGPVTPADPAGPALSERVFRCSIETTDPGGDTTVLVSNDALIRDAVPGTGAAGSPCVDIRSNSAELIVVAGGCTGRGLRAAAVEPGSYEMQFRLRTCTDPAIAPAGCGAPESDYVGRIIVDVGT